MKKLLLLLTTIILLTIPMTAFAVDLPSGDPPAPQETPGGGGGGESGGGDSGGGGGDPAPPPEPKKPEVLSYTPVVTAMHSLNALLANDGTAVYFLPRLEDFPVDLTTTCADVTSEDGQSHKFAVVYDGYFDNEVMYSEAVNANTDTSDVTRLQTSKKVYTQSDNSRMLNLLGYDMLLANEESTVVTKGEFISVDYFPTLVGTAPLTAKTCIMDLYKAVGIYEWDIKVVYGIDESLKVSTSPIMQQIAVLTNDEVEGGIDTKEGASYVWATRTNPNIYWERCKRDAIFDGGAHKYTKPVYVGNSVSVTFSKNETDTVNMGEFCQLARAIMELYGEPVLTEQEIDLMIQAYSLSLPTGNMSQEQMEAIRYLAAKGIVDPKNMNWSKAVTFADVEEILLRIADEDSRLTLKHNVNMDNVMSQMGFVKAKLGDTSTTFNSIEEIVNPYDSDYYDYYIEAVDGYTNFYLKKLSGHDMDEQENVGTGPTNSNQVPESISYTTTTADDNTSMHSQGVAITNIPTGSMNEVAISNGYVFACDKLVVAGADSVFTTTGSGYFNYLGMDTWDDRYYYHFRISRALDEVTIKYDYDPELEQLYDITEYTLPNATGGVYNFSDGLEPYMTFDQAIFSGTYIDAERVANDPYDLADTQSYLSQYTWLRLEYDDATWTSLLSSADPNAGRVYEYSQGGNNYCITVAELNSIIDSQPMQDGQGNIWYAKLTSNASSSTKIIITMQTKLPYNTALNGFVNATSVKGESSCFYRNEDNVLLVSYSYLKNNGLAYGLSKTASGNGYSFVAKKLSSTNVVLRSDLNLICIGDTFRKVSGEPLYFQDSDNEVYINAKACLGWSTNYVVVSNDETLIPLFNINDQLSSGFTSNISNKGIKTFYPDSSVNVPYQKVDLNSAGLHAEGFMMAGNDVLGSHCVVLDDSTDTDYLFVWHRQDVVPRGGAPYHIDDADARQRFQSMTGISLGSVSDVYGLACFPLNRNNSGNPSGLRYVSYRYKASYTEGETIVGYLYNPPSYGSIYDAMAQYIGCSASQALPIAKVNSGFVNLNQNTCTDLEGNPQLPMGTMPTALRGSSYKSDETMSQLTDTGSYANTAATYDNLDNVIIYTAPVGLFSQIKGLGKVKVSSFNGSKGSLYFGGSACTVDTGSSVLVGGKIIECDGNTDAVKAFAGAGSSSVYVISEDNSSLGDYLDELMVEAEVIVTEPESLIDWEQYKFNRLVHDVDSWTTILLIFVLNILPRVAMLLFFVLMLLSLIKDVKPWRMFCERVFDIYSFLTLGKQNVNTIDTKRVVFISWCCLVIFAIIMDGHLFNFIIFVCKFFIILSQR